MKRNIKKEGLLPIMNMSKIKETKKYRHLSHGAQKMNWTAAFLLCATCVYLLLSFFPPFLTPAFAAKTSASSAGPLRMTMPAQVAAGKTFVLTLSTDDAFPPLRNEYAALFESYNGGKPRLNRIHTLDARGTASIQLQNKKAGLYRYEAWVGPFQSEATVIVHPGPPSIIREIQEHVFLEAGHHATVEFSAWDPFENKIAADSPQGQQAKKLLNVSIADPEQNLLSKKEYEITSNPAGHFVISFIAEKMGNYLVEVRPLDNSGPPACSLVCARKPGAVVGIGLETQNGGEPFLRISEDRAQPGRLKLKATLHGENNIDRAVSPGEEQNIIFSTDRPDLLRIDKLTEGEAILTEKGEGGLATITATYLEEGKGMQKSIPLWIAGDPAQIKLETKINGLTAQVQATLLDKKSRPTREKTKAYRLDLPKGLKATAQTEFDRGQARFAIEAEAYGSYTMKIATKEGLHRSLNIDLVEKIQPARHAVIFIGQEAYIRDGQPAKISPAPEMFQGRVFVPIEFLTTVFGMEVSVPPETKKVALQSLDGMKITIDQESGLLTVTDTVDGTTKTTPAGTLTLQKKDETYFAPAGIIARLLGIEVDYLPKHDQIEHVTFKR
ncbi:MAG: hypothetical protein GX325_10645 [Peptococcaceae bacterium]|nr:hypothetical protein [Peptococcaceae bacterium]